MVRRCALGHCRQQRSVRLAAPRGRQRLRALPPRRGRTSSTARSTSVPRAARRRAGTEQRSLKVRARVPVADADYEVTARRGLPDEWRRNPHHRKTSISIRGPPRRPPPHSPARALADCVDDYTVNCEEPDYRRPDRPAAGPARRARGPIADEAPPLGRRAVRAPVAPRRPAHGAGGVLSAADRGARGRPADYVRAIPCRSTRRRRTWTCSGTTSTSSPRSGPGAMR
jgi:hypothetical protein